MIVWHEFKYSSFFLRTLYRNHEFDLMVQLKLLALVHLVKVDHPLVHCLFTKSQLPNEITVRLLLLNLVVCVTLELRRTRSCRGNVQLTHFFNKSLLLG